MAENTILYGSIQLRFFFKYPVSFDFWTAAQGHPRKPLAASQEPTAAFRRSL